MLNLFFGSLTSFISDIAANQNNHLRPKMLNRAILSSIIAVLLLSLVPDLCFSAYYRPVVFAGTRSGYLYRVHVETGSIDWTVSGLGSIECVAAARVGGYVLVGATSNTYLYSSGGNHVWTRNIGVPSRDLVDVTPVAISADGYYSVVAHNDGTIRLYSKLCDEIWSYSFNAASVAMNWLGNRIIAGGTSGVAYFDDGGNGWDGSDATPVWSNGDHDVLNVAINNPLSGEDADYFMVAGGDGNGIVRLYGTGSSVPIWTYTNPQGGLMSVDINNWGNMVAAANDDPSNSNGAQLDLFREDHDGTAGWSTADGVPHWTHRPTTAGGADCRALDFEFYSLPSGGTSGYTLYLHNAAAGSTPEWTGSLPAGREVESIEYSHTADTPEYIITSDTNYPEILIFDKNHALPIHTVATTGNVTYVSVTGQTKDIPTLSDWGMILLVLVLITFGALCIMRKRRILMG